MNNEHLFPELPGGPAKPVSDPSAPLLARAVILLGQLKARDEERDKQLKVEIAERNKLLARQEAALAEQKRDAREALAEQAREFEEKLEELDHDLTFRIQVAASKQRILQVVVALVVIAAVILCRVL